MTVQSAHVVCGEDVKVTKIIRCLGSTVDDSVGSRQKVPWQIGLSPLVIASLKTSNRWCFQYLH